jgi:enoyl-CoA hydratase
VNHLRLTATGRVLEVVMDRPPVNALGEQLKREMIATFESVNDQSNVSAVILKGAGKGFSGGADVTEFAGLIDAPPEVRAERDVLTTRVYTSLYEVQVPVICQIHGFAVGGGLAIASLCDFRIAASDAFFSMPEIDRGTVAGGGSFFNRLGMRTGAIRQLVFTGQRFSAEAALNMGLVDSVVPDEELDSTSMALAEILGSKSRRALELAKRAANEAEIQPDWRVAYAAATKLNTELATSADGKEGFLAFLEKREPRYAE